MTRPDLIVGKAKAGMVEDVGCVRANLEDTLSPDVEVLAEREVDVREAWAVQRVPPHISKCSRRRLHEGIDIEPLVRRSMRSRLRIANLVGILGDVGIAVVIFHDRGERTSGLNHDGCRCLPAANSLRQNGIVTQKLLAVAERIGASPTRRRSCV